jgi:ADP-ribose pyrophosphatase
VHPGAVLVVPVLDDGRLVLERQFRYPVRRVMLEFPRARSTPANRHSHAPRASSRKRPGYAAATWKKLGTIHPEIGYSTEFIEMYEATASGTSASGWTKANSSTSC